MANSSDIMVGNYFNNLHRDNAALMGLREATAALPEGYMKVDESQARFMAFLTASLAFEKALELGTFTGYNALSMALAGSEQFRIVTCDISMRWKQIARQHWEASGVGHKIEFRLRAAMQVLDALLSKGQNGTFDFIFIDADKESQIEYYEKSLQLLRVGGVLIVDNILLGGSVLRDNVSDTRFSLSEIESVRALNSRIARDERVECSFLAFADGIALIRKL